jgi:hypothetical protein
LLRTTGPGSAGTGARLSWGDAAVFRDAPCQNSWWVLNSGRIDYASWIGVHTTWDDRGTGGKLGDSTGYEKKRLAGEFPRRSRL